MVRVRHVRVRMAQGRVVMRVAVLSHWHLLMRMQVVTVIMAVGVLMLQRRVLMLVGVVLQQVQHDASQHQDAAQNQHPSNGSTAHRKRSRSADERRKRKHRARSSSTKGALRQQVKTQTQTITRCTNRQQCGNGP